MINESKTLKELSNNRKYIQKLCNVLGYEFKSYIDCGNHGYAYLLSDNKVLKITTDTSEFLVANKLKGKKLKRISNVYDTYKLNMSDVYIIVLEYIQPLSDELRDILEEWIYINNPDEKNELEVWVFNEIKNIFDELKSNNIENPYDYKWWMNMGLKNGNLAVFDVGDKSIIYNDYDNLDIQNWEV